MDLPSRSGRILVVDDNAGVRGMLAAVMMLLGFKVDQASDGSQALELFSKRDFDLILTDLDMPGMNGLNLASRIKMESPQTPVVLVTGEAPQMVAKRLKEGSIDTVIFKPFRLEDFVEILRPWIGSRVSDLSADLLQPESQKGGPS